MDWVSGPLQCCCVSPGSRPTYTGDLPASSSYRHGPAVPGLDAVAPSVLEPRPAQGSLGEGVRGPERSQGAEDDFGSTSRSVASVESAMSAQEREREKARLAKLVKGFAREAVIGVPLSIVCPKTGRITSCCFQMNRTLTSFSLRPTDGTTPHAAASRAVSVKDLAWIGKGAEVATREPSLGGAACACVGLGTKRGDQQIVIHFNESLERDRFYTCLRVLRMSTDVCGS
mmetsp:Transcript_108239/g.345123  ORF Transcript_108239/g.345123 Transcript_108239/m.345123 type:complete len:229 (+) Transcript_108239:109-795(+)